VQKKVNERRKQKIGQELGAATARRKNDVVYTYISNQANNIKNTKKKNTKNTNNVHPPSTSARGATHSLPCPPARLTDSLTQLLYPLPFPRALQKRAISSHAIVPIILG